MSDTWATKYFQYFTPDGAKNGGLKYAAVGTVHLPQNYYDCFGTGHNEMVANDMADR